MSDPISRRKALLGAVAGTAVGVVGGYVAFDRYRVWTQPEARVTTLRADSYDADFVDLIVRGLQDYPHVIARAKGARVVLKPNLVEWHADRPINTHPHVVRAAGEAFRRVGAKEVVVAEGPGHRRDTEVLVESSGLGAALEDAGLPWIDLNADVPAALALRDNWTGLGKLHVGRTAATADLLVSVARLKLHHWAGVTLTMKNLFGVVSGQIYGWPKNPLHWAGIENSIVDLWSTLQPGFGIIDGVIGMEGDGPLMGTARSVGALVMGDQLPAVDATAARLMGLDPYRLDYLTLARRSGGTLDESRIEVIGDRITPVPFVLPESLSWLK